MIPALRVRRKYLFYIVAITSTIFSAVTVGMDTLITSRLSEYYPAGEVSWIYGFNTFFIGLFTTILICLFLSIRVRGRRLGSVIIDPAFDGLRFITKEEFRYHIFAGLGNAISTIGYFYVLSLMVDPSAVIPFFRVVILYLLLVEMIAEKNAPTLIEVQSSVIVTLGAILGSISISGNIEIAPLAAMFFIVNPGWVLFSISQRKLKLLRINGKPNDSINIRLWNLIFTLVFVIAIMLIHDISTGTSYIADSLRNCGEILGMVAISTGLTFFAYVLYIRALGMGKASITEAVRASIVIFSIPVTFIISHIVEIPVPQSAVLWLIKAIGIILVVLGILSFALAQITAYIFIKAKSGVRIEKLIERIWKIRGIESVSAVTGNYDLIAKVRIRTLPKGYERIIRKLESIPDIYEFRWYSVLKEWSVV